MTHKEFAQRRRGMGISQGRISRRVGFSQTAISQWEIGNSDLRPDQVAKLVEALRHEAEQVAENLRYIEQELGAARA
jgi:transcriptional regulator with XRE-family HTH domain